MVAEPACDAVSGTWNRAHAIDGESLLLAVVTRSTRRQRVGGSWVVHDHVDGVGRAPAGTGYDDRERQHLEENPIRDTGNVGVETALPATELDVAGATSVGGTPIVGVNGQWVGDSTGLIGPPGSTAPLGLS